MGISMYSLKPMGGAGFYLGLIERPPVFWINPPLPVGFWWNVVGFYWGRLRFLVKSVS
jgi:hypothetical protein